MSSNPYETDKILADYLLFHYGSDDQIMPWPDGPGSALRFPLRSVNDLIDPLTPPVGNASRALDVGCAVGRSCYELAAKFDEVIGIDDSATFIQAAETVRLRGELPFRRLEEGIIETTLVARRPESCDASRIRFQQGDAMTLDAELLGGPFDLVHAANLICRLPEPLRFLDALPDLVKPGGQLLLTTPATWLEEFTPREHWPATHILSWLSQHLLPAFELEFSTDMPMFIRETRRKYQWTMVLGSRWRRRM